MEFLFYWERSNISCFHGDFMRSASYYLEDWNYKNDGSLEGGWS